MGSRAPGSDGYEGSDPGGAGVSEAAASLFRVFWSSFPRRQQARRLRRAAASCAAAITAGALAVTAAGAGATALAGLLAVVMAALAAGRSSLGSPGRPQRCRRSVRGSGSTGARRAGGGGVAAAALAPVWRARGYRQRRDRPDRHRVRDRDQNAHVRRAPPGPRPADGRVALPASPALVSARSAPGAVRGACPRVGGGRGRGSCGLA